MRALMRCAVRLYPASWRARYGGEFDALMEDIEPGWKDFVDVCGGAIKMRILRGSPVRFTAACALVGLLIAGVVVLRMPGMYRSEAVLRMPAGIDLDQLNRTEQKVLSRRSLAQMIQQYDLYPEERRREPLEDIVLGMRNRNLQIRAVDPKAFTLAFVYRDPKKAQAVTQALIAQFTGAMPLEVLDPASLAERAYAPNRPIWLAAGLVLGAIAAILLIGIRRSQVVGRIP